jgi:hypothetical protein
MAGSQRRQLFVSSQIQGVLLWRLTAFWVLYHLYLWHAMFLVSAFQQPTGRSVFDDYRTFLTNDTLLPWAAAALFPLVFWSLLNLTHRIAGPLVQVRNRLRAMAAGQPPAPVQFRQGDLLSELEEAFNNYVGFCRLRGEGADPETRLWQESQELLQQVGQRGETATPESTAAATPV